jgi:RecB family endonuclease NucS
VVSEVDDLGLGRLRRVANVRDIWSHEATAFTPWLSKHLDILGNELGAHLAVVATEVPIGEFRLDIQALDEQGRTVIIENQLEPSDHAHLGQLVVYASGVDASTVIWVARKRRDKPAWRRR